ncbi:hypothetical protein HZA44_03665 [Candidatus Peregrinibacteria bacterium]|nr:hypothetical protein [Candidatus Peregrinibacteria bacterium]
MARMKEEILNLIRSMDDVCQAMLDEIEGKSAESDHARKLEMIRIQVDLRELEQSAHEIRSSDLEAKLDAVGKKLRELYRGGCGYGAPESIE